MTPNALAGAETRAAQLHGALRRAISVGPGTLATMRLATRVACFGDRRGVEPRLITTEIMGSFLGFMSSKAHIFSPGSAAEDVAYRAAAGVHPLRQSRTPCGARCKDVGKRDPRSGPLLDVPRGICQQRHAALQNLRVHTIAFFVCLLPVTADGVNVDAT